MKITKLAGKAFGAAKKFWDDCTEAENYVAAQRVAAMQESARICYRADMKVHYDAVASSVKKWLEDEHSAVGLARPANIEGVLCDEDNNAIDGDYNFVVFRYELKRVVVNLLNGGGVKTPSPNVPVAVIEKNVCAGLRKYLRRQSYDYTGQIYVTDVPGDKVRIEISGLYRLPVQQHDAPTFWGV